MRETSEEERGTREGKSNGFCFDSFLVPLHSFLMRGKPRIYVGAGFAARHGLLRTTAQGFV